MQAGSERFGTPVQEAVATVPTTSPADTQKVNGRPLTSFQQLYSKMSTAAADGCYLLA